MRAGLTTRADVEDMLARLALGDRSALPRLHAATSAKLFGVVLRVLNDRADAEDALQDIYVKVWLNAGRYRANGLSPMSWLIAVARNHALDLLRQRQRRRSVPIDEMVELACPLPSPEDTAVAASLRRRVAACLAELGADHADAVCGAYLHDVPDRDLATRYDVPLNTMKTRLRRSLLKLRASLETSQE